MPVYVEHAMGMPIVIEVRDGDAAEAVERVFDWFRFVDEMFSTYKDGSEISRLARDVLARCEELHGETDGYFDARAGGLLDPSGLVKGWSVDRAAAILDESGLRGYAVNAGGDIRVRGRWRVGIQHPTVRDRIAAVVEARDLAIATSGAYARGDHVLDPHSGGAPRGILSVTVVGPE